MQNPQDTVQTVDSALEMLNKSHLTEDHDASTCLTAKEKPQQRTTLHWLPLPAILHTPAL